MIFERDPKEGGFVGTCRECTTRTVISAGACIRLGGDELERGMRLKQAAHMNCTGLFDAVTLDPPWSADSGGGGKGANSKYELIPDNRLIETIVGADIWQPAPAFWCGIWVTVGSLPMGLRLLDGLGCRYVTSWYWIKTNAQGQLPIGIGQYARHGQVEQVLIGKRGQIGKREDAPKNLRAGFEAPVGKHSEKPSVFYENFAAVFGTVGRRVALFERKERPGFAVWGNEAPGAT